LQFLTFKLSFNDYYAQDISNKIKSVKSRKIEKGEFQGGIAPYGYKKDDKIKNHLIIDEYATGIVKDIFDMYVNKGMSTIKIADKLNEKEILAPAVYLKIPTYINKKSSNPKGKYIWLRNQINNILRNEVYIGNVIGGKYRKVSHKIAKVKKTKKEEHVVVENMHEPIIDLYTWNKAQEKLNARNVSRERKYDHPLKGLIFCKECGKIATLRCRTEKRKSGKIWRADYFICSNRNSYRSLCECKQIKANIIEDEIKRILNNEIEKIKFLNKELKQIYNDAQIKLKEEKSKLEKDLDKLRQKLDLQNRMLIELYEDKVNKVIKVEDFERMYHQKNDEKKGIIKKIKNIEAEIKKIEEKINDVDMEKIENRAKEILSLDNITKEMYQKLIERIEFDKEKKIFIKFKFAKYTEK
jgi:putative site-specific recombinase, resolvase family